MSDSKRTLGDIRAELERLAKENPEAFARATREAGRESEMMLSAYVKAIFSNRAGFGDSVPPMPPTDIQLLASIVLCPHDVARFAPCADCLSASRPLTAAPEQRDAMALLRHVGAMFGSEFRYRWDPVHGRYLLREEPLDDVARSIVSKREPIPLAAHDPEQTPVTTLTPEQQDAIVDAVRRELARFGRAAPSGEAATLRESSVAHAELSRVGAALENLERTSRAIGPARRSHEFNPRHDPSDPSSLPYVAVPPSTPAAMLGEVLGLLDKARAILAKACPGDAVADRADDDIDEAVHRIAGLRCEAEAREAASAQPVCTACGHRHGEGVAGWPKACETCNAEGGFCEATR